MTEAQWWKIHKINKTIYKYLIQGKGKCLWESECGSTAVSTLYLNTVTVLSYFPSVLNGTSCVFPLANRWIRWGPSWCRREPSDRTWSVTSWAWRDRYWPLTSHNASTTNHRLIYFYKKTSVHFLNILDRTSDPIICYHMTIIPHKGFI